MKKNYASFLVFLFALFTTSVFGQAHDEYVTIPNGSATTVVIQDVLANDTYLGAPATLSNVQFTMVSTSSAYLSLDQATGSVIFANGPAPIGTYTLEYYYDGLGLFSDYNRGVAYVNIGCDQVNAPIVTNVTSGACGSSTSSVTLSGLPTSGWYILDHQSIVRTGTSATTTLTNVYQGIHEYHVANTQGCISPPTTVVTGYLSLSAAGNYVDSNSDGVPSVGDTIFYEATVTNVSNCTVTNIITGGNSPLLGGPIASLAAGASDNATFTAAHQLTQANINAGYVTKTFFILGTSNGSSIGSAGVSVSNYFNQSDGIRLLAFVDTNANGVMDGDEHPFNGGEFNYTVNNDGTVHHVYSNFGTYLYESNPATSYDINFHVFNPAFYGGLGTTVTFNDITVPNGSGITTLNFPLTIIPFNDASVEIYGYGAPPRPGFSYQNRITVRNNGNLLIPSGTLTFTKNNVASLTAVSMPQAVITATGFTYDFTNLQPGESFYINVTMLTPTIPTVQLGNVLTNSATVSVTTDNAPLNNDASLSQVIVGSYDPNEKDEAHGGKVLYAGFTSEDYLTYKIQFENTGTFPAEFVKVVDVLDDKLDETTVRMVDASHSYTLDRVGKELTWMFDDIQLPPSVANTNIGHGYLVFKVKPKAGYALGDVIPNIANIYFDFNPPIVTDPCVTEFVLTLATQDFTFDNFRYSPNPVKNTLNVSNDTAIEKVTITSVLGQTVLEKTVNSLDAAIDLSNLPKGVYLVKASSLSASKTFKVIKE